MRFLFEEQLLLFCLEAELFAHLSDQGFFGLLTWLNLSCREVPHIGALLLFAFSKGQEEPSLFVVEDELNDASLAGHGLLCLLRFINLELAKNWQLTTFLYSPSYGKQR